MGLQKINIIIILVVVFVVDQSVTQSGDYEYDSNYDTEYESSERENEMKFPVYFNKTSFLNELNNGNGSYLYIMFYVGWCGYSMQLVPTWDELAFEYNNQTQTSNVIVGAVECDDERDLCGYFKIMSYPNLRLFKSKTETSIKYEGNRTLSTLKHFLTENLNESKFEETSNNQLLANNNFNINPIDITIFDDMLDNIGNINKSLDLEETQNYLDFSELNFEIEFDQTTLATDLSELNDEIEFDQTTLASNISDTISTLQNSNENPIEQENGEESGEQQVSGARSWLTTFSKTLTVLVLLLNFVI